MKKLIITMIAIAFSLSAFSRTGHTIYVLDEYKSSSQSTEVLITVWCIADRVFVEGSKEGGLTEYGLNCGRYISNAR